MGRFIYVDRSVLILKKKNSILQPSYKDETADENYDDDFVNELSGPANANIELLCSSSLYHFSCSSSNHKL